MFYNKFSKHSPIDGQALYAHTCAACSRLITRRYSTSFSMGIRAFHKSLRLPIYSIYGFVRLADEIVDSLHAFDKADLLSGFRDDTFQAIADGVSLNPVLHSFQKVVNEYDIDLSLIHAFLDSMEMDLHHSEYETEQYQNYIYGSAEVVGLMCLQVFCEGDRSLYHSLKVPARKLGEAFQKVNFLRDMGSDYEERGRIYFPGVDFANFCDLRKRAIEEDIRSDFDAAYAGIVRLPPKARFGVYIAYVYYERLFRKIQHTKAADILVKRIRIPDSLKYYLFLKSTILMQLRMI